MDRLGVVITKKMVPGFETISGPCVVENSASQTGRRYFMYFSCHIGEVIRVAIADQVEGPWEVEAEPALNLSSCKKIYDHIASPHVIFDASRELFVMFFHGRHIDFGREQFTFMALSRNGVNFECNNEKPVAPFYLRVIQYQRRFLGISKGGEIHEAEHWGDEFAFLNNPFQIRSEHDLYYNHPGSLRHPCFDLVGNVLWIYFTRIGDMPESIFRIKAVYRSDRLLLEGEEELVLAPERDYEGFDCNLEMSESGPALARERALRDPYVLNTNGRKYLFYSVAGEDGIALAETQMD